MQIDTVLKPCITFASHYLPKVLISEFIRTEVFTRFSSGGSIDLNAVLVTQPICLICLFTFRWKCRILIKGLPCCWQNIQGLDRRRSKCSSELITHDVTNNQLGWIGKEYRELDILAVSNLPRTDSGEMHFSAIGCFCKENKINWFPSVS